MRGCARPRLRHVPPGTAPGVGHALFQPRDAWLELRFVDDVFGIAIDQPTNPAPQGGYLAIEAKDFIRHGGTITRPGHAAAISSATRCGFQESSHLIPHDLFQLIAAHGAVVAHCLAIEAVAIRADTAIIAQNVRRIVFT